MTKTVVIDPGDEVIVRCREGQFTRFFTELAIAKKNDDRDNNGGKDMSFYYALAYIPQGVDAALKIARENGARIKKDDFLKKLADLIVEFTQNDLRSVQEKERQWLDNVAEGKGYVPDR